MKSSHFLFFCWIIIHVLAIIYATISEIWGHFQPVCKGGPKDKTMLRHKIDCDKCPERILLFCQVFVFLSFFYSMFLFFSIYYVLHKKRIICHFYNSESSTTDNQTKREVEETIKNWDFELYWALICCTH